MFLSVCVVEGQSLRLLFIDFLPSQKWLYHLQTAVFCQEDLQYTFCNLWAEFFTERPVLK